MLRNAKYLSAIAVGVLSVTIFLSKGETTFHMMFNIVAAPAVLTLIIFDDKRGYLWILLISISALMLKNLLQFFIWNLLMRGTDAMATPITVLFFSIEVIMFVVMIVIIRNLPWVSERNG